MKRPSLTAVVVATVSVFLLAFLGYPLLYSCRGAFFDGSWLLLEGEVVDWQRLCGALAREDRSAPDARIWELLPAEARAAAQEASAAGRASTEQRAEVLAGLNAVLKNRDVYQRRAFAGVPVPKRAVRLAEQKEAHDAALAVARRVDALREQAEALADPAARAALDRQIEGLEESAALADDPGALSQRRSIRLNRMLVEAAQPDAVARIRFSQGHFTLQFFKYLWVDTLTRQSILNSFVLATMVTVLTAALALPLSLVIVRYRFPGKGILTGLLLLPLIMPPFVGAIGMRQLLARFGSINLLLLQAGVIQSPVDWLGGAKFWGVVIMEVLHLYPIMYLNFAAALANVDPSLEEAAVNMGSSGPSLFRKITLPLMMPGLFAGSVIVFIWSFTDLGTPLVFEYRRVVPVQIFTQVTEIETNPQGYALVVGVLAMTVLMYLASKRLFGMRAYQTLSKGPVHGGEKRVGSVTGILMAGFIVAVVAVACLPHAAVVLTALKDKWFMSVLPQSYTLGHFRDALGHDMTLPSIRNSILYSSMSTVLDVTLGILIAYVLVRHPFRGAGLLDACVMLPLAVPGLVLAFGYVAAFAGTPIDPSKNPTVLLVIAYAVRRLPYMVRAAYAGFQQVNVQLEEAAVNLGSTPLRAVRRVTAPLLSANLIAGGILVFSFAMLEVSDSLILAMKENYYPITKAIYELVQRIEDGPYIASALGVWAMVFLGLSLMTAGVLLGRRMGQLFRI